MWLVDSSLAMKTWISVEASEQLVPRNTRTKVHSCYFRRLPASSRGGLWEKERALVNGSNRFYRKQWNPSIFIQTKRSTPRLQEYFQTSSSAPLNETARVGRNHKLLARLQPSAACPLHSPGPEVVAVSGVCFGKTSVQSVAAILVFV